MSNLALSSLLLVYTIAELLEELIKSITIGECLLLHQSGFAIPCRNGKPIGAIDE